MAETKKKNNTLTGVDPESVINMKYCEAIKKELGKANADDLNKLALKKKTVKK